MIYKLVMFNADGIKERQVLYVNYVLDQQTDQECQPVGRVRGGKITIRTRSLPDGNTELFDWMCSPYLCKDGYIAYTNKMDEDMKRLVFKEAYMVSYSETYDFSDDDNKQVEEFVITAKEIRIGASFHRNTWTVDD